MNRRGLAAFLLHLLRVLLLAGAPGVAAQPGHDHAPLPIDEELGLDEVFARALENAPAALETAERGRQAAAFAAAGRSWIAGRPSLQLDYFDDGPYDGPGMRELEYAVQLPLWRPGERADARRLGSSYAGEAAAWEGWLRLQVAGWLRGNLADLREAATVLALEQEAARDAEELLRITTALFEAGELARQDVLQSRALLLEQRREVLHAEAALVDAEREYALVTGLTRRPQALAENTAPATAIDDAHPHLRYLRAGVELAAAEVRQAQREARGSPVLSIGGRRDRADAFEPYEDAVALSLNVPFGGKAFSDAGASAARRGQVDAEVRYLEARRALTLRLHEVLHEFALLEESLPLAREQATLGEERWEMARAAFEAGETTLAPVVLALQQARAAAREWRLLELRRQRLAAQYNQTLGVLP